MATSQGKGYGTQSIETWAILHIYLLYICIEMYNVIIFHWRESP